MRVPFLRFCLIALLHLSCGCDQLSQKLGLGEKKASDEGALQSEKHGHEKGSAAPASTSGNTPANAVAQAQEPDNAAQFNADYEKWKLRAVEEFPEIGKAGSRFNQQFLLEAKKLRESNAPELAHPNWPYLLALMVNTSLERSGGTQPGGAPISPVGSPKTGAGANVPQPSEPQDMSDRFGNYAVSDLTKMRTLPKGGTFKGTITRVEKQIASGDLDIVMTLDGILLCEINLDRNTSESRTSSGYYSPSYYYRGSSKHSNLLEVIQEQNSLKLVEKQTASTRSSYTGRTYTQTGRRDLLTLAVGQTVFVEGMLLLKANKKPFLKGIIKSD
jgi:hypothetical protein